MPLAQVAADPIEERFREAERWRYLRGQRLFPKRDQDDPVAQRVEAAVHEFVDQQLGQLLGAPQDDALTPEELAQVRELLGAPPAGQFDSLEVRALKVVAQRVLNGSQEQSALPAPQLTRGERKNTQVRPVSKRQAPPEDPPDEEPEFDTTDESEEVDQPVHGAVPPIVRPPPSKEELEATSASQAGREARMAEQQFSQATGQSR